MSKQTWGYLIKDNFTGFYKIGFSDDPRKRLKNLMRQPTLLPMPNDFVLHDAWFLSASAEKDLHNEFKELRQRGEWFALSENDISYIEELLENYKRFSKGMSDQEDHEYRIQLKNEAFTSGADYVDWYFEAAGIEF